jgi:hypothetical protein
LKPFSINEFHSNEVVDGAVSVVTVEDDECESCGNPSEKLLLPSEDVDT